MTPTFPRCYNCRLRPMRPEGGKLYGDGVLKLVCPVCGCTLLWPSPDIVLPPAPREGQSWFWHDRDGRQYRWHHRREQWVMIKDVPEEK